ncbi:MAG: cyclic pyranopterin monophosphate synthase MoaC [Dehalococcoidia bacterium]|nr:cyclic pyranopterin monophosphate synthase MoaC [Dehalococcoidia bacterium]
MPELTHVNEVGEARMVDVGAKADSEREAIASGGVRMKAETLGKIRQMDIKKGDVLAVARIAGIMAAKRTPELIPLCHTILVTEVTVDFDFKGDDYIEVVARAKCSGKTGVEMEALTAVSVSCLTIYDMCKAIDRAMVIDSIRLEKKSGGKSGTYIREEE